MFGSIGGMELIVLAVIGLLVFGPRKLPEIGRTLGKAMAEFRRSAMELRSSIEREVHLEEIQQIRDASRSLQRAGEDLLKEALPSLPNLASMEEDADKTKTKDIKEDAGRPGHVVPPD